MADEKVIKKRASGADIVVGIASFNNASTIRHVVDAVEAGLTKYFPRERCAVINSDGGSTDGTVEVVKSANFDHKTIFLDTPREKYHRVTMPYHGISGKGSAMRAVFERAVDMGAKACCVVDADLRSITPEWIELLLVPVLRESYDFVAPLYSRHKYDGSITNSIIYPLTRALYGRVIRQPIGGEFGFSGALAAHYLTDEEVWETNVARFGIDIWMTTEAIAGGFKLCQSYLGAKIHDPKDPGADLADMFVQVVGSLMTLTEKHHRHWRDVSEAVDVATFGFKYYVALDPVEVNVEKMAVLFREGFGRVVEDGSCPLPASTVERIKAVAAAPAGEISFPLELWVEVVYESILAHHRDTGPLGAVLNTLLPLYLGWTASFFRALKGKNHDEAEAAVEETCREFERRKAGFVEAW